jgi:D-beta-D-heptose 7-phosphate kinase/D-beta-D-heptose 1-phosphate adenosyltransferase
VVGDVMLDAFVWGGVSRISPEAPVPVVQVERRSYTPGGAANTAAVDLGPVLRDPHRPTTTKTRIVAHSQQVVRFDHEVTGPLDQAGEDALLDRVAGVLGKVHACVVSDYGKGVISTGFAPRLIDLARSRGVPVIIDPKGVDYEKYRSATVVKPNQLEAGKVLNRDLRTEEDVDRAAADLGALLGPDTAVLITRGAQGMSLFEPGRGPVHVPAQAREVYDVTGAGDTVAATMALALASGLPLATACRLASLAAAVVVAKVGTATCTLEELIAAGH